MSSSKPHALVFPMPIQGHINPMMLLAHHLASAGILVTFVHSGRNHSLLRNTKLDPADALHPDPPGFPVAVAVLDDGLPTDAEYRPSPVELDQGMREMVSGFDELIQNLNRGEHPISCLVSDTFLHWTQDAADRFGIPRIEFWTSTATFYSMGFHIPLLISEGINPSHQGGVHGATTNAKEETRITCIPGLPPMRESEFPSYLLTGNTKHPLFQLFTQMFAHAKEARCVLLHSIYELESRVVDALREAGIAIYTVGPLLHRSLTRTLPGKLTQPSLFAEDETCLQWLDTQAPSSVLYVSFGSFSSLPAAQLQELVQGLGGSEQPFILVIRPDDAAKATISEILPQGFVNRTKERSLIVSWAPQLSVLAHVSVGGFLTHCGWNSIMESMLMGVPVLGWPRMADQMTNLKLVVEEWKIGIAIERQGDGIASREVIEKAVRALLEGKEGKEARRNAVEVRETLRKAMLDGGTSKRNLDNLVEDITQMARDGNPLK